MTNDAHVGNGLVRIASHHDVAATAARLQAILKERAITLFAKIDFGADATSVGLHMRAEQLLIFGNPKAGTPLMVAQPELGIDLPFKALIWEDGDGATWITYNMPQYLIERHGMPVESSAGFAVLIPILQQAAA